MVLGHLVLHSKLVPIFNKELKVCFISFELLGHYVKLVVFQKNKGGKTMYSKEVTQVTLFCVFAINLSNSEIAFFVWVIELGELIPFWFYNTAMSASWHWKKDKPIRGFWILDCLLNVESAFSLWEVAKRRKRIHSFCCHAEDIFGKQLRCDPEWLQDVLKLSWLGDCRYFHFLWEIV